MSKSPAALSGPLFFWRRPEQPQPSQNQPAAPKDSKGNGRSPFRLSSLKTKQSNKNEKHP